MNKLQHVKHIVETWKPRMLLSEWTIDVRIEKNPPNQDKHAPSNGETLADVSSDPTYLKAVIRIYPDFWTRDIENQTRAIVHELAHCLTQELFECVRSLWRDEVVTQHEARDRLERLTQRIALIAMASA